MATQSIVEADADTEVRPAIVTTTAFDAFDTLCTSGTAAPTPVTVQLIK